MDNIKEVAKVITEYAMRKDISGTPEEVFAFACLAKIANEPERKTGLVKDISDALDYLKENADLTPYLPGRPGRLKGVIANIEAKNGKLTREQAMIAYCSGKKIRVMIDSRDDYDAWLVGQTPFVQFDNKKPSIGAIPLFVDGDCRRFKVVPKLVDGLTACQAFRSGKRIKCDGKVFMPETDSPNFMIDDWEIID